MESATEKNGVESPVVAKAAGGSLGDACRPVVEKCEGCERTSMVEETKFCKVFPNPAVKWRIGNCTMATHIKVEIKGEGGKARVGQQKQKKK